MILISEKETDNKQIKDSREYKFLNTPLGRVVYFQYEGYTQWKNITNGDLLWTIKPTDLFTAIHSDKPVHTFVSKRISGFSTEKVFVVGENKYYLAEKKKADGYLYEIPTTLLRLYTKKEYPEMEFPYTRYKINTVAACNYLTLERLKTEETIRYNRELIHSVSDVSIICGEVYRYCKSNNKN